MCCREAQTQTHRERNTCVHAYLDDAPDVVPHRLNLQVRLEGLHLLLLVVFRRASRGFDNEWGGTRDRTWPQCEGGRRRRRQVDRSIQ